MRAVVIKMTNACNLNCAYCYVSCTRKMNDIVENNCIYRNAQKIVTYLVNNFSYTKERPLGLYFHGGEPLLEFENIKRIIKWLYDSDIRERVKLMIQTNGVLLSDDVIEYIKKMDICLGISLDGVGAFNNARCGYNGLCTDETVLDSIIRTKKKGVDVGVATVLTRENVSGLNNLFETLLHVGVNSATINFLVKNGRAKGKPDLALPNEEIIKAMVGLHKWIKRTKANGESFFERTTYSLEHLLFKGRPFFMCSSFPCGFGKETLGVDIQGNIYLCDQFISHKEMSIGNINEMSCDMIFDEFRYKAKVCGVSEILEKEKCVSCKFVKTCPRGCPAIEYFNYSNHQENIMCEFYRKFFEYLVAEGPAYF